MKTVRNSYRCMVMVILVNLIWVFVANADESTLFMDHIKGYTVGEQYYNVNSDVVRSQYNGGNTRVYSSKNSWSLTPPDQFVEIQSGSYGNYTTIAVTNQTSNHRYGQVGVLLGKTRLIWVRLALFDINNASFPSDAGRSTNTGPDLLWDVNYLFRYYSNGSMTTMTTRYDVPEFHYVNINYDLQLDTYEVWYDKTRIIDSVAFNNELETIEALAIGGAYWGASNYAALDYWHWKVSDTTPFTSHIVPPVGTIIVVQ